MDVCSFTESNRVNQHKKIKLIKFTISHQLFSIQQALVASGMSIDEFSKIKGYIFCRDDSLEKLNDRDEERAWQLTVQAIDDYREYLDDEDFYQKSIKISRAI